MKIGPFDILTYNYRTFWQIFFSTELSRSQFLTPLTCQSRIQSLISEIRSFVLTSIKLKHQLRAFLLVGSREVEFKKMKELCYKKSEDQDRRSTTISRYGVAAQMNFQFHILARLNVTCNVPRENIKVHLKFKFVSVTRLNWAKSCNKEHNVPWQIILGSSDLSFCVLISLALLSSYVRMNKKIY